MEQTLNQEKPKKYLYHMVPADMEGTKLQPLNTLKDTHPHLYNSKIQKYAGREEINAKVIPTLECLWNDVLQFSPIEPAELKAALVEAGMEPRVMKFFQIDPDLLDPEKTTIYLYRGDSDIEDANSYEPFRTDELLKHGALSEITKSYYKRMYESGKKPLMFIGVPHILHKGPIDISDLDVITV